MARFNPVQFYQEVRQESSKVTWPTRKAVIAWTIAVLVMVSLACAFFFVTDMVLQAGISQILELNRR
jgi:preprotein translocase subunit SecE